MYSAARKISTVTIKRRRSKRSAKTPASGPRNTAGNKRAMKTPAIAKLAVEYDPPESCCASAVVASSPSQSPRDEKTIEFQSLRNGLIERTLRVTSCAGAAGRGSDEVMGVSLSGLDFAAGKA